MSKEPEELEFGNFRILRQDDGALWELGRGGFGTTYKAEHKHLMRTCALKVINDSRVASEDARRRFLQEARAAASLQHPHIAAVYDFGESDGTFYYAMEYCAGGDLEKYSSDKGALTWQELEPLVVQIAGALLRAHESGMLHRDLKPSNIMLSSDEEELPQLKLIDFGLVKILDHVETATTQVMMTQEGAAGFNPLTASPEQLLDEELDERSDLFSFGVTLLYLLCGGVPFGNVSAPLMMAQRLDDKPYDHLLPDSLTGHGREIVSRLLQKDRDNRFRTAADILTAISNPTEIVISEPPPEPEIEPEDVIEVEAIEEAEEERSETEIDWVSAWEVKQIQQRGRSGSYYKCAGRQQGIPDVVMFLPDEESVQIDTIIDNAEKLIGLRDSNLLGNYDVGHLDGERAYLSDPFIGQGGRLLDLLQAEGHFTLQTHLSLFQQISKAIDNAVELGLPGLELNASMILVDERYNGDGALPSNSDEWLAYYRQQVSQNNTFARDSSLSILPKLEEPSDEEDIQATVTLEDLATDPLTKFGSLIYRSISGMSVRPAAYMRESGYVSTSNLGEESNRFLAEIIAGRSEVVTATDIIIRLCEYEGVTWSTELLDVNMHKRAATREVFGSEVRGVYERLKDALKAAKLGDKIENQRRASEAAKLEKRARRQKELAEKKTQEDAVKKQEEEKTKETERLRLIAKEEQKEKERLAREQEAAEKKRETEEKEKQATKGALKKKQAEEAAKKAKQSEQEAKELEAAAKVKAETEKKRLEAESKKTEEQKREEEKRQKTEQEKKRREEEQRQKAKKEKERLAKIAEEKRLKIIKDQAAAQKQEAEKQKQILAEQKRAADEQKKETLRLEKEAQAATKQAEREKKALEKQQREAEKAKEKIYRERQKLSAKESGGGGLALKKKPIIIGAAALLAVSLVTAGLISRGGDGDTPASGSGGDTASKSTEPMAPDKPTAPSSYIMEIPLADGGKDVPEGVILSLASPDGSIEYGQFEKKEGRLVSKIKNESRPAAGAQYSIRVKNANYVLSKPVSFNAESFIEGASETYKLKHNLQVRVHAQFKVTPQFKGIDGDMTRYQRQLLKLLNQRGVCQFIGSDGEKVANTKVTYEESTGSAKIDFPEGFSLHEKPIELRIQWPGLSIVRVEITEKGLAESPWNIELAKYNLNVSTLLKLLPKFEKVVYKPTYTSGAYSGLAELLDALSKKEQAENAVSYEDIQKGKKTVSVSGLNGSLFLSGGIIADKGLQLDSIVRSGKIVSSSPEFPKNFYSGFMHVPLFNSSKQWITEAGLCAVDLSGSEQEAGPSSLPLKLMFVDGKNRWLPINVRLKVASWNAAKKSWLLEGKFDNQQSMTLEVIKNSSSGDWRFRYTEIGPIAQFGTTLFEPARRRGLSVLVRGDRYYAAIDMKLSSEPNRQSFLQKLDKHLEEVKGEYKKIKTHYQYQLPKNYPHVDLEILKKLADAP